MTIGTMRRMTPMTDLHRPAPQCDELLNAAADKLRSADSWTIFTHRRADGDAMGSSSALFEVGRLAGKDVRWLGFDSELPPSYSFLVSAGEYRHVDSFDFAAERGLCVFLDCANEMRIIDDTSELPVSIAGADVLNIDHHADNTLFGTVNCVVPSSSSTSELLFRVIKVGGLPMSCGAAESLYTGIWTDSGGFSFSNTSPLTHRLAAELMEFGVDHVSIDEHINQTRSLECTALWARAFEHVRLFGPGNIFALSWLSFDDFKETGARGSDTEGMAGSLMYMKGVRLAVFMSEKKKGVVKLSFRSTSGIFPCSDAAHEFGGGGHPRASGARLQMPVDECIKVVTDCLERMYADWAASDR